MRGRRFRRPTPRQGGGASSLPPLRPTSAEEQAVDWIVGGWWVGWGLWIGWLVLFTSGCASPLPADVSYAEHVAPVLQRHCVRCHEEGGQLFAGVGVDQFLNARSTRVRSVCTAVGAAVVEAYADELTSASQPEAGPCGPWAVGSMPPGAKYRLTGVEQELLARWVATGAQP